MRRKQQLDKSVRKRSLVRTWGSLVMVLAVAGGLAFAGGAVTTGDSAGSPLAAAAAPMALINESTVSGSPSLEQQAAEAVGYTVSVVTDATWGAMTAAEFAAYDLLIVGDTGFGGSTPGLVSSSSVWGSVVMGKAGGRTLAGNRVVVGTDPSDHVSGLTDPRSAVIREGIAYAGGNIGATNMYFTTSEGYTGSGTVADDLVTMLTAISGTASEGVTGAWTVNGAPPCGGSVSLIAANPAFVQTTTASLQGWSCSVHISFPTFPSDWSALAVATDTPTQPTCGIDPNTQVGACGESYVLVAGSSIVVRSLVISISPETATNPSGTTHTVTANVHQAAVAPPYVGVAGQHVDFVVTGQNAGAAGTCVPANCTSDANGDVTFTYQDANGPGDDTIKASFTDSGGSLQSATAQKTWDSGSGFTLTVNIVGPGSVASSPGGISCPTTCSATFADGTPVDLSATPDAGASFVEWSGDCTGTAACQVMLDADRTVTATFNGTPQPQPTPDEIDGSGKICAPEKIEFEFDDVEVKGAGELRGEVEFEAEDAKFKSSKIDLLFTYQNIGLVISSGKFNGNSGYRAVALVLDNGKDPANPDLLAFYVEDSSYNVVLTSEMLQPVCKGDIEIEESD